jgi:hypothetical protein
MLNVGLVKEFYDEAYDFFFKIAHNEFWLGFFLP